MMNLSEIRNKYKQIIDDSDDSQDELPTNTNKIELVRTRILTEHNQNLIHSNVNDYHSSKVVISLKQRIAQGIKNMANKQNQNANLKNQISKLQSKIQLLQQQLTNIRKSIDKQGTKLVQEKVKSNTLQAQIDKLSQHIKTYEMDKELIYKKIEFYKKQISHHKLEKQNLSKQIELFEKQIKQVQKIKAFNHRLKDDLKRMHVMLNQFTQKKSSKKIEDKHYLGKPFKEYQSWFPQNLVGQVEIFLKKQQVAQGNKDFITNLVKFIDRYTKQVKKQKRVNPHCKPKQQKTKLYLSSSLCEKNTSTMKSQILEKSTLKQSILFSRFTKNGSKKCTQSLLYTQPCLETKCQQILTQYSNMIFEVVHQKDFKKKKILRLSQQMKKNILSLFDGENEIRN